MIEVNQQRVVEGKPYTDAEHLLVSIDRLELSERLAGLKERFFRDKPGISAERAKLAMEAWKETERELPERRSAMKLQRILEGISIVIHPGDLLASSSTKYFREAHPAVDWSDSLLEPLMAEGERTRQMTLGGPAVTGVTTPEDWGTLKEAMEFFRNKTVCEKQSEVVRDLVGTWWQDAEESALTNPLFSPPIPTVAQFDKLLGVGLRGIIREAEEHIRGFIEDSEDDVEKLDFWQAVIIACEATIRFGRRYAQLAREMAAKEADLKRRVELEEIAEVCERVPENPARTFHEAIQSMVLFDVAASIEQPVTKPAGGGRLDQILYPYFKRDLEEGRLTLERAADLLGCLWAYWARRDRVVEITNRENTQKGNFMNITLGGYTRQGEDATNELSYLILHMAGLCPYAEPHISFQWCKKTPRWLMLKALDTNVKTHGGLPQFQNGDHIIEWLMDKGASVEDAREWTGIGCSHSVLPNEREGPTILWLNVALPVDLVLHNGVASLTGKRIGMETGDPRHFRTFEEFYDAYKRQIEYTMRRLLWLFNVQMRVKVDGWRLPLSSALAPGCLEKGRGEYRGGLPSHRIWNLIDRGYIPAADSLIAVKRLVYEERKLSMDELIQALDTNFEGERGEEIRQMCLAAPKFGNDIDEVDEMVREIGKLGAKIISSTKNIFGWPYTIDRNGVGWHLRSGIRMGALPCGRKAREPLPDASLSPMQGMDTHGPTAVIKSCLKADFKEVNAGIINQKLPSYLVQSQEVREKVVDFTQSYFRAGGTYIQFNIVDKELLLEAKKHPEEHGDLLVRVGGFSAYFVELSPEIQDEIIARTEHSF